MKPLLTFELDGISELKKNLDSKSFVKAVKRTVKEEGRRFVTQAVKSVTQEYNITAKELKSYMRVTAGDADDPYVEVSVESARLPLSKFSPQARAVRTSKGTRKGVTVKVKKGNRRKLVKGAFLSSDGHIYKRESKPRYPIKFLRGISVPQMFTKEIVAEGMEKVKRSFPDTFRRNLNFYLSKAK